jgi:sec-independent protein translocase protein TatB
MFPEGRALEFLLAAVIALVVVGPKDLPVLLRKLGQFMGKMRGLAAEFRASFDEMARQAELDELRKEVEAMRHAQLTDVATHAGVAEIRDVFTDIDRSVSGRPADPPPPSWQPEPASPLPDAAPVATAPPETAPAPARKRRARPSAAAMTEGAGEPAAEAAPPKAARTRKPRKPAEPEA